MHIIRVLSGHMSPEERIYPESRQESHSLRNSAAIIVLGLASYIAYDAYIDNNSQITTDDTSESSPEIETESIGPNFPEVIATEAPLMPEEAQPFGLPDIDRDTNDGLAGLSNEEDLRTPESRAAYFNRVEATLRENPELAAQILGNFKLYDMFTSPLMVGPDRLNLQTPEDGGLGWDAEIWNDSVLAQQNFESIFGESWGSNNLIVESPENFENLVTEYQEQNLFVSQGTVEGFDNVFEGTYAQIRGHIENYEPAQDWSEERKESTALAIMDILIYQRIEGSVSWGTRPMQKLVNGQIVDFADVSNGEGGFVTCRVDGERYTPDITEQDLTLQEIRIVDSGSRTIEQMSFDRDARDDMYLVVLTFDSSAFRNIDEYNFVNEFVDNVAYEIFGLGTLHTNPQDGEPNLIPSGYEISGDTQEETPIELGDNVDAYRRCDETEPQPAIVSTPEAQPTESHEPTCEETGTCDEDEETCEDRGDCVKDDRGNQTNPDGETEAPPEGGTINDPEAEQGSDTNPGSGH